MHFRTFLLAAFCAVLLCACKPRPAESGQETYTKKVLFSMGTVVELTLPSKHVHEADNVSVLINGFSDTISQDCAEISQPGAKEINKLTYDLLLTEQNYYSMTEGHFNSAIFTVSSLYGFPAGPYKEPGAQALDDAITRAVGGRVTVFEENGKYFADGGGLKIDLGAFAKGWIVDQASDYLKNKGINNFIVSAGGDLYASGSKAGKPWHLGIADPHKQLPYLEAAALKDKGLATSGTYERYFITKDGQHISHIFDGKTGKTADTYISVSVIADSAELADLFSTVYYFTPPEELPALCATHGTSVMTLDTEGIKRTYCDWDSYIRKQ